MAPALFVGVLLALGTWQTVDRYPVWRDQGTLLRQSVEDAPLSYRAHYAYGDFLARQGRRHEAESEYLTAIKLFPPEMLSGSVLARRSTRVYQSLGNLYRNAGLCEPAVEAYRAGLSLSASVQFNDVRQSMIACLLYLGDYHEAAAEARIGVAGAWNAPRFRRYLALADSARAAGAPPGTVRITDE
jgi:tetratricopeptide (TPR) repeat protein